VRESDGVGQITREEAIDFLTTGARDIAVLEAG
jgi:hypothetical protein